MTESTFIKALGTRLDLVKFTDFLLGAIAVPAKPMAAWNGVDFFDGDPSLAMLMDSYVADTIATLSAHSANGTWALATQWGGVTSSDPLKALQENIGYHPVGILVVSSLDLMRVE